MLRLLNRTSSHFCRRCFFCYFVGRHAVLLHRWLSRVLRGNGCRVSRPLEVPWSCGPSGGGGLSCGGGGGGGSQRALLPLGALLRNDPAVCGAGAGRARPPPFASCRFSSRSRWSSNRSSGPPAKLSRARRCWYLWSSVIRLGAPELVPTSPSTLQSVVPHCMDSPVRSASSFDGGLRTFRGASSLFAMGAAGGAFR